jgi:hypothetical protein
MFYIRFTFALPISEHQVADIGILPCHLLAILHPIDRFPSFMQLMRH